MGGLEATHRLRQGQQSWEITIYHVSDFLFRFSVTVDCLWIPSLLRPNRPLLLSVAA
jgi:hypothetical protein